MLPKIISATGAALSAEDMATAVRLLCTLNGRQAGIFIITDQNTGLKVEFHVYKNIALVTPGGCTDYVTTSMPNPVPYRGVSIGVAADTSNSVRTYVMASDGEVLASEVQTSVDVGGGYTKYDYDSAVTSDYLHGQAWNGGDNLWMFESTIPTNSVYPSAYRFNHKINFTVPEDCLFPVASQVPMYPDWYTNTGNHLDEWKTDWAAGVIALKLRRKNWFKKNSDEFITAIKAGFAPDSNVTRAELKTGALPTAWQTKIKTDVDNKYDSYPKDEYDIQVGRHTKRAIEFQENGFSEVVESDTSANLTIPGVKRTKRMVTVNYTADDIPHEVLITGYLTQTVTRHDNSSGTQVGLSRKDVYDTYYYRLSDTVPSEIINNANRVYANDRLTTQIGAVFSGTYQDGYSPDSLYGAPNNHPTYANYIPPYPARTINITSSLIDGGEEFMKTWHKDSKITYDKTGAGASNYQNDSVMHGVTEVHITPVGMIADFTTNISKSGTLNGYPGNNGHLKAGTYYGRVFALSKDGTEFIKCSAVKKVTVTNPNTEAGDGTNSILWSWTKMTYVDTDGVTKDVATYYQQVWSVPDGTGTWYTPGGALSGVQTDMTMGYPHPFATFDANKVGIFHGVSGTMDGNRLRIYGTAIYKFDWNTGALTFKSWKPLTETDGDGNTVEIPHREVAMAGAQVWSENQINCIITYKGLHWPDVIEAVKLRDKDMASGTFAYSDPTLNELIKAKKAA